MTLVVGVNLGYYALLAGDSRATFFDPEKAEPEIHEGTEKVRKTPIGLATGAGLLEMVFPAIDGLNQEPAEFDLSDPQEMGDYFREFAKARKAAMRPHVSDPRVLAEMDHVGWVLSSVEDGELALRRYNWISAFESEWFPEGTPASMLPSDMTAELSKPAEMQLMRSLRVCRRERDLDSSLEHNLRMVVRYFRQQSLVSTILGSGVQIGYHTRDAETEILDIMQLADVAG
jgi:hypothetical protein